MLQRPRSASRKSDGDKTLLPLTVEQSSASIASRATAPCAVAVASLDGTNVSNRDNQGGGGGDVEDGAGRCAPLLSRRAGALARAAAWRARRRVGATLSALFILFAVYHIVRDHGAELRRGVPGLLVGQRVASASDINDDGAAAALVDTPWSALQHLVIVAGHSVFIGTDLGRVESESSWMLEPYQRGHVPTYLAHIRAGVERAAADNASMLLFSGGDSRRSAGPRCEAESYWNVAEAKQWYGHRDAVRWRAVTEEFARDSFENLLFSVCRFRQLTGRRYPRRITLVSMDIKRRRFVDMHRVAMRYPLERFEFVGIDPPDGYSAHGAGAEGEQRFAAGPYSRDPYGCREPSLVQKRAARNPFMWPVPYPRGCEEIAPLFRHCGRALYAGRLPWTEWPAADDSRRHDGGGDAALPVRR